MITYQSRPIWQHLSLWIVVAAALGGLGVWWWHGHAAEQGTDVVQGANTAKRALWPASGARDAHPASALLSPPAILEDGRPADFTVEEWSALKAAMAKTPNPKAETERVIKYLRFQRGFEQWQGMQGSADVAQRQALARQLMEQVPERMRQGELTMGEALMLETALWTDLEPNEEVRKQRLEEAKVLLSNAAPKVDPQQQVQEAAMLAEYKRREAAIVADWQAKPAAERNQAKLEEALEGARRAVYAGNKN